LRALNAQFCVLEVLLQCKTAGHAGA
jgi:hypothetical protein